MLNTVTVDCHARRCSSTHEFTVVELVRLAEEMSREDWEDGPRCLRHWLDRVADGQWGYRAADQVSPKVVFEVNEHKARRKVYADHSLILTYRPNPDALWEDVGHWGPGDPARKGSILGGPVFHKMASASEVDG